MNFSFASNKKVVAAVVAVLLAVLGLVKVLGSEEAAPVVETAATAPATTAEGEGEVAAPADTATTPATPAAPAQ